VGEGWGVTIPLRSASQGREGNGNVMDMGEGENLSERGDSDRLLSLPMGMRGEGREIGKA
jgi:hypothetical protein